MPFSSQKTFEQVYKSIDMQPGDQMATTEHPPSTKYESMIFKTARDKVGVDAVYFYRPPTGGTSIPYIFFRKLRGQSKPEIAQELAELHRLAWNMGRAPLLFAALPDGHVRIYDLYKTPTQVGRDYQAGLIESLDAFTQTEKLRQTYHRWEFESGRFWRHNQDRFDPKNRADQLLLQNLKTLRTTLIGKLPDLEPQIASDVVHRLLARAIFIKYLEDRTDSNGQNVFPNDFFSQFVDQATCFADVLIDKDATFELFKALNQQFNGDLFPITAPESEHIQITHLEELAPFLGGRVRLTDKQLGLWQFYSFDVIPIEFISSIYEEFFHISEREVTKQKVAKTGTHYTPHHLVSLMVDEIFPWEGTEISLNTLDPACGSGIFLVEIYRRLIAHWEQIHPDKQIQFQDLKELLTQNIYGIDLDPNAVHVAAFSLYLTLCDFLEPRQIREVKFPLLRQKNLFPRADFFDDKQPFNTKQFDLIIGNPPWQSSLTDKAKAYCDWQKKLFPERQFSPDKQIAIPFLWRSIQFCKPTGEICLLMPSKGLLFNRSGTYTDFRQDFLASYHVETIINLSAYRHILFKNATGPGAIIIYKPTAPDEDIPILYCSPKPTHSKDDQWQFVIEPQDIAELPREEAHDNDVIWKVAMWGGPRDYELIKRLNSLPYQTFEQVCDSRDPKWVHAEGIVVGNKKYEVSWLVGKPYLDIKRFNRFSILEATLPLFKEKWVQRSAKTRQAIFQTPHIVVKQSPMAGEKSLQSAFLDQDAIFKHSILGIHGPEKDIDYLAQCCLVLNSQILLYVALMTSRRWLIERDELEKDEIMNFPMPPDLFKDPITVSDLQNLADDPDWETKVNKQAEQLYDLTLQEQILIDDAFDYTLDYFRRKDKSIALDPTFNSQHGEQHLTEYLQTLQNTLQNSFGQPFRAIIYQGEKSPLRIVALRLISESIAEITTEPSEQALDKILTELNEYLTNQRSPGVFIKRHVRAYLGKTIYIVKPDQKRHWTRSMALRDADEIYADMMGHQESLG
ncbi:MAG: N-6 DNA methylase [Anaerolineae bacterium]|nr:N-6 DNA methylase [Anaerolineae bacterium]